MSALLEVEGLTKRFSGVVAVKDVSFTLGAGEITGVLGPNGAGKTTLFNLLTGFLPSDAGEARFEGKSILRTAPHAIVNRGVARTFQLCRPFHGMTVRENVAVGCLAPRVHAGGGLEQRVAEILGEVGLAHKAQQPVEILLRQTSQDFVFGGINFLEGWHAAPQFRSRFPADSKRHRREVEQSGKIALPISGAGHLFRFQ